MCSKVLVIRTDHESLQHLNGPEDVNPHNNIIFETHKRLNHNPRKLKSLFEIQPNNLLNQGYGRIWPLNYKNKNDLPMKLFNVAKMNKFEIEFDEEQKENDLASI